MRQLCMVVVLLGCSAHYCFAQNDERHQYAVRFNPLGLFDPSDANFTLGIEKKIESRWDAGLDAGYIFGSYYFLQIKSVHGYILRPFVKLYPKPASRFFIAAELHLKHVAYQMEDYIGRNPVNGIPAYEEFTRFTYIKDAVGLHFLFGKQSSLLRNNRLLIEPVIGMGFRLKKEFTKAGLYDPRDGVGINRPQSDTYLLGMVVPMNLRLVYVWKQ